MPPAKSKVQPDDSRSEASSTKEKAGASSLGVVNGKARRTGGNTNTGSLLRDSVTAGPSNTNPVSSDIVPADTNPGLQWASFEPAILHGYRYDYRLNTPAAFNKTHNQLVLARSPIGKMSPTMAKRKDHRRQSPDELANSVRKHFNSMGIIENEVVVDFLYKVRWQDKNFRMRFAPQRPR